MQMNTLYAAVQRVQRLLNKCIQFSLGKFCVFAFNFHSGNLVFLDVQSLAFLGIGIYKFVNTFFMY